MAAWLVCATVVLNLVWGAHLDDVPRPPESFSLWLAKLYGATNNADLADLEAAYGMFVSFLAVEFITLMGLVTWRILRRRR